MIKIGLLSDTHSYIDPKMIAFLKDCDEIWHAGDIGNVSVIDALGAKRKVRAVFGNIDGNVIRQEFKKNEIFTVENVKVFITHIGGYPNRYAPGIRQIITHEKPKLFIAGHSHILKVIYDKKLECLHINPGAAGIQGFHKLRTMVRFKIFGSEIKDLEIWEYPR